MAHVRRMKYKDSDGKEVDVEDDVSPFQMHELIVRFNCPICSEEQKRSLEPSPSSDVTHVCSSCSNEYFLFQMAPKKRSSNLRERMEQQLDSVRMIHPIAEKWPARARKVAFAPLLVITAGIPIVFGFFLGGVFTWLLVQGRLFTLGSILLVVLWVSQTIITMVSEYTGPFQYTADAIRFYRSIDEECSFTTFIRRVGDYYHIEPYEFR